MTKHKLDLYYVMANSYTKFQVHISEDNIIEKSPENIILAKGNNSHKSRSSMMKLKLAAYFLCYDKFVYQISSQYLKRLQRKVRKTKV